ncbi:hypothetical protein CVT24_003291 [Panaeolus cyanescens]|uniref:Polysaccharide lyase 14 domain-containing protein n=1 Tax=Panaeolus cyanescens TaxID=181874 RepID=A0A409YRD9_9AGAR|nr:hypothetical protein CVT24_003291 [Panaeolus cyanescens]
MFFSSIKFINVVVFCAVVVGSVGAAPLKVRRQLAKRVPSEDTLFPLGRGVASWTTHAGASGALELNDDAFRPTKIGGGPGHAYLDAPDGVFSMRAHYPEGSFKPSAQPVGGISFYAPGPEGVDLTTAKEATFGYSIMFPDGFEFVKGGKLPGFYGGNSDSVATSCSGGRRDSACFSARLMWRTDGQGEFYTYLPPFTDPQFAANERQCEFPNSDCNPTYGASIGRGSFSFAAGQRTTVAERVRLNDDGVANGELELFVEGASIIKLGGLILRDSDAGKIRGIQMQTFFGGSSPDWATPKDQDVFFSDFSVAITETFDGQKARRSISKKEGDWFKPTDGETFK